MEKVKNPVIIILLFVLAACNDDVFVDKTTHSLSSRELDGDGGIATLAVSNSGRALDIKGRPLNRNITSSSPEWSKTSFNKSIILRETEIYDVETDFLKLQIRNDGKGHVEIEVFHNEYPDTIAVSLRIVDNYEYVEDELKILPGSPYRVEKVEYTLSDSYSYSEKFVQANTAWFRNDTDSPVTFTIKPRTTPRTTAHFSALYGHRDMSYAEILLRNSPETEVTVPMIVDGRPRLTSHNAIFGFEPQPVSGTSFDDPYPTFSVDAQKGCYAVLNVDYRQYQYSCRIYLRQDNTGKQKELEGTIHVDVPLRYTVYAR